MDQPSESIPAEAKQTATDLKLQERLVTRFREDPRLAAADVEVFVLRRFVFLRGYVLSTKERRTAREIAQEFLAAREIVDELSVRPGQKVDDLNLTARVNTAFEEDPRVLRSTIHIHVSEGVVKLVGNVGSVDERNDATEICLNLSGVRDVDNRLRIAPHRKFVDSSISAAARLALRKKLPRLSEEVCVSTVNGVLMLSGTVKSARLKGQIEGLAKRCQGVVDVDDRLTVKK